jgi:hypothetical protein
MAKVKAAARKRRPYEYDHQYGLTVAGKATKAISGKARGVKKKAAKKR